MSRFSRQTTGANGSGSYVYDAFGRQTTIPAADAPNNAGAAITMSYFDTDAVRSITQTTGAGTDTTTFTLDPDGRRLTSTDVIGSTTTVTTNHYALGSDNPAWSSQMSGSSTTNSSYLPTLGSASAVVSTSSGATTASLSLIDLAGSVVASVGVSSSADSLGISGYSSFDEYGNAESAGASTGVNVYGWEGGAQRAVTNAGLTLMGARVYNVASGRFMTSDRVMGGNENAYNSPNDPMDTADLSGLYFTVTPWKVSNKSVSTPHKCNNGKSGSALETRVATDHYGGQAHGKFVIKRAEVWLDECQVHEILNWGAFGGAVLGAAGGTAIGLAFGGPVGAIIGAGLGAAVGALGPSLLSACDSYGHGVVIAYDVQDYQRVGYQPSCKGQY